MAWGSNSAGQLGNGTSGPGTDSLYPTTGLGPRPASPRWRPASTTRLALDSGGNVTAWGYDQDGELGDGGFGSNAGDAADRVPEQPDRERGPRRSRRASTTASPCWATAACRPGAATATARSATARPAGPAYTPTQALAGGILAISAGGAFSQALTSLHTLDVFGANASGQLGNGTTADSSTPVNTLTPTGVIQPYLYAATGGTTHALAIQNLPPVAVRQTYTVSQNGRTVTAPGLLMGASDAEGDGPLTVLPFTARATTHGTVTVRADGSFTYTPVAGYQGSDVFTYQVSDGLAVSAPVAVTLTVTTLTLKSLSVTPPAPSVAEKATVQFHATGTYNDGSQQDFTSGGELDFVRPDRRLDLQGRPGDRVGVEPRHGDDHRGLLRPVRHGDPHGRADAPGDHRHASQSLPGQGADPAVHGDGLVYRQWADGGRHPAGHLVHVQQPGRDDLQQRRHEGRRHRPGRQRGGDLRHGSRHGSHRARPASRSLRPC